MDVSSSCFQLTKKTEFVTGSFYSFRLVTPEQDAPLAAENNND